MIWHEYNYYDQYLIILACDTKQQTDKQLNLIIIIINVKLIVLISFLKWV